MRYLALALLLYAGLALGEARQVDEYNWQGVERVVAVGDLHGDYGHYLETLEAAGLVDRRGKWSGGATHLVQTGDIPDRGPDTVKIIEHLAGLDKQARRKGGRVHNLIGNHEAMNVYGDLRYVSEGEYRAFETRKSAALRDRYYELFLEGLERQDPERFAALPDDYRAEWDEQYPLGWVEHRMAWDLRWDQDAEYANWVLESPVALQINDSIFVHGGISGAYCRNSLSSLAGKVHAALREFDPADSGILEDEYGPLWYRGLSGVEPQAPVETVDAILEHHGVSRIVVGHTPTSGVIWPRYDGKVVMIDTGIAQAYGGNPAYLELTAAGAVAGYPAGKLALPLDDEGRVAYLEQVLEMDPENPYLKKRLRDMTAPPAPPEPDAVAVEAGAEAGAEAAEPPAPVGPLVPICGIVE